VWAEDLMYNSYSELDWLQINKSQADIHIQAIAELMWDAMNESTPKQLQAGEFHLPFSDKINDGELAQAASPNKSLVYSNTNLEELKLKVCVSRCARISYETLGDNPKVDYEADIRLHDRLADMKHWSPFEHCAKAMSNEEYFTYHNGLVEGEFDSHTEIGSFFRILEEPKFMKDKRNGWCRNYRGFIPYRHLVEKDLI
jgi:hypothetical protein